jgi:hypothetical protein
MPNSARLATVNGSSKMIKKNTTRRSRHVRGMKNRAIMGSSLGQRDAWRAMSDSRDALSAVDRGQADVE